MALPPGKPNRSIEASLHQGPVTGMLDSILLSEMRQICDDDEGLAEAQRAALEMSWWLHALVAQRVTRI
jgi:hypothetical protein